MNKSRNGRALGKWMNQSRREIGTAVGNTTLTTILDGINGNKKIHVVYRGGSTPGASRWIHPRRVYRNDSGLYVEAYCEKRQSTRTFDANKFSVLGVAPVAETTKREFTEANSPAASSVSLSDVLFGYFAVIVIYVIPPLVLLLALSSLF